MFPARPRLFFRPREKSGPPAVGSPPICLTCACLAGAQPRSSMGTKRDSVRPM